jgi:ABC-2 type transport system ATP-binding protein
MATAPVIVTEGLTRRFDEVVAVHDLALEIHQGEIFGCLGHNGAGKTTTVRLLNGVLKPQMGKMQVLGMDPVTEGATLRLYTGVLTETPSLDERLSARENLSIFAELYQVPEAQVAQRVDELLDFFELADRADEKVIGYSKGMRQRLALSRALIHNPEILFLDEPTAGLDPLATLHVHQLIAHLSEEEGHTVFLCTHNLVEAQKLCDRVAVMEHGQLIAVGTPVELAQQVARAVQLELEVAPGQTSRCVELLRTRAGVQAAQRRDGSLAITGVDRRNIPDLVRALVAGGIAIYRVAPMEPSLEDVYLALHGER